MKTHQVLGAVAVLLLPVSAGAGSFRVSQVPNAPRSCNTCHTNGGGTPRNAFGLDVEENLENFDPEVPAADNNDDVQWDLIFDLDSDGDGFTNGEELGDPDGLFPLTDAPLPRDAPGFVATAPGDPDDSPECGNEALEGLEECDDGNLTDGDGCDAECLTEEIDNANDNENSNDNSNANDNSNMNSNENGGTPGADDPGMSDAPSDDGATDDSEGGCAAGGGVLLLLPLMRRKRSSRRRC